MFLPLSDSPNPAGRPYVTYALIAANILVYLLVSFPLSSQAPDPQDPVLGAYVSYLRDALPNDAAVYRALRQVSAYDLFVFAHGYKPGDPSLADLFASLFLHGGLMHLLGNMLFLWIYGDNVEYRLGRLAYLFWYLVTGAAATLFFALFAGSSMTPLVGASGAISGVLGFYFVWFPRNRVRVFVMLFPFFMDVVSIPARIVLGIYLLIDNVFPFLFSSDSGGGVAYGAHIGGFLAGAVAALVIDRLHKGTARIGLPDDAMAAPPAVTVDAALAAGDVAGAARAYFAMGPEQADRDVPAATTLDLAWRLAMAGYTDAAVVLYKRALARQGRGPGAAAAHVGLGLIQLDRLGQVAPAYQHFLEALENDPEPGVESAAREALARIADLQKLKVGRRLV